MSQASPGQADHPVWAAFRDRYQGHPALADDPVYSLAESFVDAITEHVPSFFTEEQKRFERELARVTGGGFFRKLPIGLPASPVHRPGFATGQCFFLAPEPHVTTDTESRPAPPVKPEWVADPRTEPAVDVLRNARNRGRGDAHKADLNKAESMERGEGRLIARRAEAYAGWLVVNPQFRWYLRFLKRHHDDDVVRMGFPDMYGGVQGRTGPPDQDWLKVSESFLVLYHRWCLDRMLTWELPAPLDPALHPYTTFGMAPGCESGVTIFLPWYLIRGNQLDLSQVARRVRLESAPEHLRDWASKGKGRAGEISYQRLYWLYRSHELVLYRRYRSACEGNIERLDRAWGAVIRRDADWVKRLRQRLARELKAAGEVSAWDAPPP